MNHSFGSVGMGRPLHEGVDRNAFLRATREAGASRPLHEGVDRNFSTLNTGGSPAWSPSSRGRGSKQDQLQTLFRDLSSPSSRGRGSKRFDVSILPARDESPSSRGRGSKPATCLWPSAQRGSPSSRGRGSKRPVPPCAMTAASRPLHEGVDRNSSGWTATTRTRVALFTRAWIETGPRLPRNRPATVALFTRAWIETGPRHCLRGRPRVALFTRAWIETGSSTATAAPKRGRPLHEGVDRNTGELKLALDGLESPSSRGRGSKPSGWFLVQAECRSPSSRGRGSKPQSAVLSCCDDGRPLHEGVDRNNPRAREGRDIRVALFTRAWIETCRP